MCPPGPEQSTISRTVRDIDCPPTTPLGSPPPLPPALTIPMLVSFVLCHKLTWEQSVSVNFPVSAEEPGPSDLLLLDQDQDCRPGAAPGPCFWGPVGPPQVPIPGPGPHSFCRSSWTIRGFLFTHTCTLVHSLTGWALYLDDIIG